jgi:hypothetical protein
MKTKLTATKHSYFLSLALITLCFFNSCQKDKLTVNEEKHYAQVVQVVQTNPEFGSWQVTLKPGGVADILPSGDIVYRGTYKISGANLKVKYDNNTDEFEILSETEIRHKEYGIILRLKK